MLALAQILRFLAVAALGVFAGAMLTEGGVLVPYWQSLSAEDFFRWYAANDRRLVGFFGALTYAMGLLSLAAAVLSLLQGSAGRWLFAGAAVLALVIVATFFVFFRDANAAFTAASVPPAELPAALATWAAWHWARTVMAIAAFALALAGVSRGD